MFCHSAQGIVLPTQRTPPDPNSESLPKSPLHLPPPPPILQNLKTLPPRPAAALTLPTPPPSYPIVRHVLGTRLLVYAHLHPLIIPAQAIGWTIRQTQYQIEGMIHSIGAGGRDGPLPTTMDPYTEDFGYGCYISLGSIARTPAGQRSLLTWGIMNSTLEGLLTIAYVQGYSYEMGIEVVEVGRGKVGEGWVKSGSIRASTQSSKGGEWIGA
ncbi:MAG: hypothetical protein Q9169_004759 [Polycauliona sp. 2 TL-2023]